VLEIGSWNVRCVHGTRGEDPLAREIDAGEVRERSAGSDQLRTTPVAARKLGFQAVANGAAQALHALGLDPGAEEFLGEANRAEGQRGEMLDHSLRGQRELE